MNVGFRLMFVYSSVRHTIHLKKKILFLFPKNIYGFCICWKEKGAY